MIPQKAIERYIVYVKTKDAHEAAKIIGVSYSALTFYFKKYGLPLIKEFNRVRLENKHKVSLEREEQSLILFKQGIPMWKIRVATGINDWHLRRIITEAGLNTRANCASLTKKLSKRDVSYIIKSYPKMSTVALAKRFNVSSTTILHHLEKAGVKRSHAHWKL